MLYSCRITIRIFHNAEESDRGNLFSERQQENHFDESQLRMSIYSGILEQSNERLEGQVHSAMDYLIRSLLKQGINSLLQHLF